MARKTREAGKASPTEGAGYWVHLDQTFTQIKAEVPGATAADVQVELEDGLLTVKSQAKTWPGLRSYRFRVGAHVCVEDIKAEVENGVVIITITHRQQKSSSGTVKIT